MPVTLSAPLNFSLLTLDYRLVAGDWKLEALFHFAHLPKMPTLGKCALGRKSKVFLVLVGKMGILPSKSGRFMGENATKHAKMDKSGHSPLKRWAFPRKKKALQERFFLDC